MDANMLNAYDALLRVDQRAVDVVINALVKKEAQIQLIRDD